eukprot:scaffold647_cov221-Chaetoceros_neogracile.AAC.1
MNLKTMRGATNNKPKHLLVFLVTVLVFGLCTSFLHPANTRNHKAQLHNRVPHCLPDCGPLFSKIDEKEDEVKVGSTEYYAGFLSRDLTERQERVDGDKVLIPTIKFAETVMHLAVRVSPSILMIQNLMNYPGNKLASILFLSKR